MGVCDAATGLDSSTGAKLIWHETSEISKLNVLRIKGETSQSRPKKKKSTIGNVSNGASAAEFPLRRRLAFPSAAAAWQLIRRQTFSTNGNRRSGF